jgi:uncharacterized protein (TIGR03437 family)
MATMLASACVFSLPITWTFQNTTLDDGATVKGSFTYDADVSDYTKQVTDWDVIVVGGDTALFPSITYTPDTGGGGTLGQGDYTFLFWVSSPPPPPAYIGDQRDIWIVPTTPLSDAGGTVPLDIQGCEGALCGIGGESYESLCSLDARRQFASGVLVASIPPPPPVISNNGVVNGASFQPGIVSNSWVTIAGTNLAPQTDTWTNAIVDGRLPTSLDGVHVIVGGEPAYIDFISPGQINLLIPDVGLGSLDLTVKTAGGTSSRVTVTSNQYAPAFFLWGSQPVATRQDFSWVAKDGTFPGVTTVPAKPGDVIILWGTGFGPTNPIAPAGTGVPYGVAYPTATLPTLTIDGLPVTVYGTALAPGVAGLYQVAIQVPNSISNGDWPIQASIGGAESPTGVMLWVEQ